MHVRKSSGVYSEGLWQQVELLRYKDASAAAGSSDESDDSEYSGPIDFRPLTREEIEDREHEAIESRNDFEGYEQQERIIEGTRF
jgi:hypothetical protein